jgi:dCMP deaminase
MTEKGTLAELRAKQRERDIYYLKLAKQVATRTKCLSRPVGSVLVTEDSVIGTGYNGPAHKIPPCSYRDDKGEYTDTVQSTVCPRQRMGFKSGEGLEYCVAAHGEMNSILQAAKVGISTAGATLYAYCGMPCANCTKEIINAGVKRVVCLSKKEYNQKLSSGDMFMRAGVLVDIVPQEELESK